MSKKHTSLIEDIAEKLGLIPTLKGHEQDYVPHLSEKGELQNFPPAEKWDDWEEYEATQWPFRKKENYTIVPTSCFNCEAGCGLLAYVRKSDQKIRKFEGNPYHPGSRGRTCAKGPATINQVNDPDRILYPLKRKGKRGEGKWERVSWDSALEDISSRMRKALEEKRNNEIAYHVGRPGHEGYMDRVLKAWGVDGHNSHTNVCSSGARFGYAIWQGYDRPSPDHANADFILLVSAHLESGHYFNPHAQRIIEGMMNGAKLAVMDPRLSNTASMADYWMPTQPGSEAAVLLAMAKVIIDENLFNEEFLRDWVNWKDFMGHEYPERPCTFAEFIRGLKETYSEYTPEFAASESGVDAKTIVDMARKIGRAGTRFATHNWRSAASGNLGGWSVARCLHFLNVLTGSVGTEGGTSPSGWNKFKPKMFDQPPAQKFWNELHFPKQYPLAHYEMSFLLPYFLKEGRGKLDVYFTRVFNPVWTYPDGFSWMEALQDESMIGLHVALTPTWNETAYFADYVLPMGVSSERHDLISYETHSGKWVAFRQPVQREALRRAGKTVEFTFEANPGEVWEEDEFWIELSWKTDPENKLGVRKHFESPYRKGKKIAIDEYYRFIFENIPALKEKAAKENLDPLSYMRKYGAFEVEETVYERHLRKIDPTTLESSEVDEKTGVIRKKGKDIGVVIGEKAVEGFHSPSRKQELYSQTMVDWGWPEYRLPTYIKSHIHPGKMDLKKGEFPLLPTFRLPNLIHSRSGNAKWLVEIAHRNPLWIHTQDAKRLGIRTNDLVKVTTDIGHFISRAWVTESIKPGVVCCSHHIGRWKRKQDPTGNRWVTNLVEMKKEKNIWSMTVMKGIRPSSSSDQDSSRIYWNDGGVHQNITFPVHPDPISGMHCWHQKVRIEKAKSTDKYGDVSVDKEKAYAVYREWLEMTRPAPGPKGLRRPLWLNRPLRPTDEMFFLSSDESTDSSVRSISSISSEK